MSRTTCGISFRCDELTIDVLRTLSIRSRAALGYPVCLDRVKRRSMIALLSLKEEGMAQIRPVY